MNAPIKLVTSSTTHLLHRAGQLAEDIFSHSIGDLGITARQYVVLSVVDGLEDPSQTTLCEISGIDRSTLADIVRRLVSSGLLTRRRTRNDARMYAVRITPEGKSDAREGRADRTGSGRRGADVTIGIGARDV